TYSSSSLGRSARSIASSLGEAGAADTMRGAGAKSSVWMLMGCSVGRLQEMTSVGVSFRQSLQSRLDAFAHTHIRRQGLEGCSRILLAVAQSHQRLLNVALHLALGRPGTGQVQVGTQFALEFQQKALRGLLAD